MLFPTAEFAIFFLLVFLTSWAVRRFHRTQKMFLTVVSYAFYGYWNWKFAFLLFECSLINYVLALWLQQTATDRHRKAILISGVVFNLGILAFFKYWGFFLSSFLDMLRSLGFERDFKIMEVLLPVGVSFFTFQGLSYIVDVYRRQIKACDSPVDVLLYISFFPQLVAGPIVRAADFLPQLEKPMDPANIRAARAFLLIGLGLFKKVVIAHYLAVELVSPVFEAPSSYSTIDLVFAVYGYALQIYCDFSAYSDIAIGIALLFGFEFCRNFNQPYRAQSLRDFWHRWHISLSSFLRDYLYIPLGGSKGKPWKTYRNLWLTMVLGGLWHGAAWNFVLWGVLHGSMLGIERFVKQNIGSISLSITGKILRTILVFHFVCLTWIFFNADDFGMAWEFILSFANVSLPVREVTPFVLFILAIGALGQFLPEDSIDRLENMAVRIPLPVQAATLGMAVVVISALGPGTLAPFIYFRF